MENEEKVYPYWETLIWGAAVDIQYLLQIKREGWIGHLKKAEIFGWTAVRGIVSHLEAKAFHSYCYFIEVSSE